MEQYIVTGMSCAACQARVEKAVSKVPGVQSCSVSLLTNSMGVEGSASSEQIIQAVEQAGYGAMEKGSRREASQESRIAAEQDALIDRETPKMKRRLTLSVLVLLPLMYITMGHNMWGWPVPAFFNHNHLALGLTQMILTWIIMMINSRFFTSGFRALIHRSPNMDTLVALGSSVSFGWSVYVLYHMTGMMMSGASSEEVMMVYHNELYFESAAMILTLITVGKMLEAMSKGRTTDALKHLLKMAPSQAVLIRDGQEVTVGIEEVRSGDLFAVRPGESIPVDGIILEGSSAVNEAALTGESIPVDKTAGDIVSAATINTTGYLRCQATRVGEDTTLSQIIRMVSDAAATKAPIAKTADRVSGIFVPVVIAISVITAAGWLLAGETLAFALARAISVLVISCPCALGLATPVAIMVGNGRGAENGVLFKTSEALEETGRTQIVALDKTGTITTGEPSVTDMIPAEGISSTQLLAAAAALESKSEHPLAKAVSAAAAKEGMHAEEVTDFRALPGHGLEARRSGALLQGGSLDYMRTAAAVSPAMQKQAEQLAERGVTPLLFAENGKLLGIIGTADVIKPESPEAVRQLQRIGMEVVMLTGDNERTARAIGRQAGVDRVIAGVLPEGKEAVIRSLQQRGRVAMVGDGINDAPALTRAQIGIAIGAGTDVAIDAADVVLMKSSLLDVPAAVRLSRQVLRNIHENLFWAFFYNLICIPLAAGVYAWKMSPMIGAAAMSLSSVTVVLNALRLNLFDMKSPAHDRQGKPALPEAAGTDQKENGNHGVDKEGKPMEKTLEIEGMMCGHCEATVKKALEAVDGVVSATADKDQKKAVVTLSKEVEDSVLRKAVEDEDYKVLSIH